MSSTKKNLFYNIWYQLLILLQPLLLSPYISRVLGADGLGTYSYSYSIASYFVIFAMLGLNNYGNRSIAIARDDQEKLNKTFWSIYGLQLIVAAFILIIYIVYIIFIVEKNRIFFILQIFLVLSSLIDINWFFFGIEKFKITIVRNTVIKLGTMVLVFLLVNEQSDGWKYTLIMSLGTLMSQILLWPFVRKYVSFYKPKLSEITIHLWPNIILFVPVIAISIYSQMDKVMLGSTRSMTEVGIYTNAERIISVPTSIISAFSTVMLPKMSNLIAKGEMKASKIYIKKSFKITLFLSSALSFGLAAVAPEFAPIFFGKEFVMSGVIIVFMSPIIVAKTWASVIRTQYLIPTKKDSVYIKSVFYGAVTNLIGNIILIRVYGVIGAAIGTLLAELLVAIYQTYRVKKDLPILDYIKNTYFFVLFGVIMFLVVRFVSSFYTPDFYFKLLTLQVIIGVGVYTMLCLIYFKRKDPQKLKYIMLFFQQIKSLINLMFKKLRKKISTSL